LKHILHLLDTAGVARGTVHTARVSVVMVIGILVSCTVEIQLSDLRYPNESVIQTPKI